MEYIEEGDLGFDPNDDGEDLENYDDSEEEESGSEGESEGCVSAVMEMPLQCTLYLLPTTP